MPIDPIKKEDLSVPLKGKSNISNYLREILQNAKKEVMICTNAEEIKSKTKLFQQTFEILKKENIKIKFALSGSEDLIKQISDKFGMKIKKVNIDAKFFIIDKKEMLFYLSKEVDEKNVAIWINSEFFVQAFASLFEKAVGK